MNRLSLSLTLSVLLATGGEFQSLAAAPDAVIHLDAGKPGIEISPELWGIFFEEINFAGDGGLYAELVRHRNFEGEKALEGWTLQLVRARADMQLDPSARMNDVRRQSLRVTVESVEKGGSANLVNSGYWGVPVKQGDKYSLSVSVKGGERYAGKPLKVSLRDEHLQRTYAEAEVGPVTTDWQNLQCTLTPDGTDTNGRLVITAGDAGEFWLGLVSLFPPTYNNEPNGLRPDLVKMLAGLKPSFVRFPGGCFVEGNTLANAFRFKETLGPIDQRQGRDCFWGYYSTDGLGYYEYLRLIEDLGADPIFCFNPGGNNGARERIALDQLEPWLQEAVDAVEFALGPADSPWGAKRAAMGHPDPFNFKTFYLQIGNETEFGQRDYHQRYAAFHDRVKQAFPDDNVRIIADGWGVGRGQDIDAYAIDNHEYPSWGRAIADRDVHDEAPRGEPFIFEGEYAARSGSGIQQALSEAVFMMGLEENSDEVKLASYAPLFGNVRGCQWNPDMIYYDNHRVMGSISYYVQQMYSHNRGQQVLPVSVEQQPARDSEEQENIAGSVGFATWSTAAEFKDLAVAVDGKTVYENKLASPADVADWDSNENSQWSVRDGALRQSSHSTDCRIWLPGQKWSKYDIRCKARKIDGAEGFMVMFHVQGADDFAWVNFGGWGNTEHGVERAQGGAKLNARNVPGSVDADRWYDVLIEVDGMKVTGSLDGKIILERDLRSLEERPKNDVYASAVTGANGDVLVRVVNIAEEPKRVKLAIAGADDLSGKGTAITLAADNRRATQKLDDPKRYTPKTSELENVSSEFERELPPCSFTILRLERKGG
jgi:alpha-L-arabinofuranosidase